MGNITDAFLPKNFYKIYKKNLPKKADNDKFRKDNHHLNC